MRPVDPTMLRRLPSLRRYLRVAGGFAVVEAGLIVAQAAFLAVALTTAVQGDFWQHGSGALPGFAAVICLRGLLSWGQRTVAARAATAVKTQLREQLLSTPDLAARGRTGETVTLATRGIDGIDGYISGYLPQLCLAAAVPLTVLIVLAYSDLAAMIIIVITLPLIPIFGVLIGWHTKAKTERQWRTMSTLGGHFLDVIAGLSTLRIFGRAAAQARNVRDIADRYRRATMETLRVAFLSALVMELVATVSVALVAVPIGLRLVEGNMDLRTAFLILLLAPEVYLPLRAMGTQFHAAQEGLAAAGDVFEVGGVESGKQGHAAQEGLAAAGDVFEVGGDRPSRDERRTQPDLSAAAESLTGQSAPHEPQAVRKPASMDTTSPITDIDITDITVHYPGRAEPALRGVTARLRPGTTVALVGPSGAGKTTILNLLLGFVAPTDGRISCGETELDQTNMEGRLRRIAWVPQRPHLFAMSVADNIALGQPHVDREQVAAAADAAFATEFISRLPAGFDTQLGEEGVGLSAGQRRRIALARAFLRVQVLDSPLVLLDEPTAGLDVHSEAVVATATERLLRGRTAVLVAHRPALLESADEIWTVTAGRLSCAAAPRRAVAGHA